MKIMAPLWEPSDTSLSEEDDTTTDLRGEFISNETDHKFSPTSKYHAVDLTDEDKFCKALNSKVNVAKIWAS